ncbi:hypothetical protein BJX68DRAFT_233234 [Aspergillus pseudodeflectus]|uniref:Uncharacterized protein n=1 Tax=Aspergillus pseudodeflectus TaxID=176178 RepID=A0ABR4KMW3_9EURO
MRQLYGKSRKRQATKCRIYLISISTGAPQPDDPEDVPDMARLMPDLSGPFMLTVRELDGELMSRLFGSTLPWLTAA